MCPWCYWQGVNVVSTTCKVKKSPGALGMELTVLVFPCDGQEDKTTTIKHLLAGADSQNTEADASLPLHVLLRLPLACTKHNSTTDTL